MTMSDEEKIEEHSACQKCEEYLTGWKRALADYDNLKKDLAKERAAIRDGTKEMLAYDLIESVDHFDQALKHKPESLSPETEKWLAGILHVRQGLEVVLKNLGLESFGETAEMFDSKQCEAVGEKTDESALDNQILQVVHRGWRMGERMVRPAKVIINSLNSKPL